MQLIAHGENSFTMEGTGSSLEELQKGPVTAMIRHRTENDRYFTGGGRVCTLSDL
jgi:hypothetical protein